MWHPRSPAFGWLSTECGRVGIPDEHWGEAVKVYIVLRDGQSATEQEMFDFCQTRMARFKVPRFVEFRADLPQNMIGKVLRRRLLEGELASSQVGASRAS